MARVRITPGFTLNLLKRGVSSLSVGRRGFHVTAGHRGLRETMVCQEAASRRRGTLVVRAG